MSCIISITIIGFSHMLYAIENLQLGLALIYCYLTYPYLQLALILAILCCFYFSGCFSFLFLNGPKDKNPSSLLSTFKSQILFLYFCVTDWNFSNNSSHCLDHFVAL